MRFLDRIIEAKKARLARAFDGERVRAVEAVAREVRRVARRHALRAALLERAGLGVIAEFKRASPSKGLIRAQAEPAWVAREYEAGGAAAISVLTEETYFRGSLEDMRDVRASVRLPVLRKDFIMCEAQIFEAAVAGADAVLLIVAALDDEELARLRHTAEDVLGMDTLVEVHTFKEMRRAEACGATLIGVNNRDLHTFEVSLDVSARLIDEAPRDALLVSESGLTTGSDIRRLSSLGYKGFLIGESLMRAAQPSRALRELLDGAQSDSVQVDGREVLERVEIS